MLNHATESSTLRLIFFLLLILLFSSSSSLCRLELILSHTTHTVFNVSARLGRKNPKTFTKTLRCAGADTAALGAKSNVEVNKRQQNQKPENQLNENEKQIQFSVIRTLEANIFTAFKA